MNEGEKDREREREKGWGRREEEKEREKIRGREKMRKVEIRRAPASQMVLSGAGEEREVDSDGSSPHRAGPLPPKEDSWGGGGGSDSPPSPCSLNQHLGLLHLP